MARARDNRKPVGEETCIKCGGQAEFYQVQKGRYLGHLYRKGCECKVVQNAPPYLQLEWMERMTRTPHPMMANPLVAGTGQFEPVTEQGGAGAVPVVPEPKKKYPIERIQPDEGQGVDPVPGGRRLSLLGVGLLIGSVLITTLS